MKNQAQVSNQKNLHAADAKLFTTHHLSEQEMSLISGGEKTQNCQEMSLISGEVKVQEAVATAYAVALADGK